MTESPIRRVARHIKRRVQALRGRDCFFKPDIDIDSTRLGSSYGGWRVPEHMLTDHSTVYSAGIGTDISFDLALIEHCGLEVHAFDPTPKSLDWLEKQKLPSRFQYFPWGFAEYDGSAEFHIPKNPDYVSHSILKSQVTTEDIIEVQVRTIQRIMTELGHSHLDLLKMDIEGSEYSVLNNLLSSPQRPTLLLIEFHHRFKSIGAQATKESVMNVRRAGYQLYSVSPSGEELCFIHNSASKTET